MENFENVDSSNGGTVISVRSSVVDVRFSERLPPLYNVLGAGDGKNIIIEVLNHLETKELKARVIAVRGNAADEILRIADEEKIDLIVIAIRGCTGLDRLIFGSVAEKVIRLTPCAILLIRRPQEEGEARPEPKKSVPFELKKTPSDIGSLIQIPKEIILEKKKAYQEKIETV